MLKSYNWNILYINTPSRVTQAMEKELIKEWVTPRQGQPKGLCSVYKSSLDYTIQGADDKLGQFLDQDI
jgi:hypothetical protein